VLEHLYVAPDSMSAERFGGDISHVLASTFSRRAPSGQLGKDWKWDDGAMQWQRPAVQLTITNESSAAVASSPNSVMAMPGTPTPMASSPTTKPSGGSKKGTMTMTEDELRARLRPLFDKFDVDSSGSISTIEMTGILMQLKIKMTPAQINAMMREADPDGSGEVDFEEFVIVLKVQMEAGGQLAAVVEEASSAFGFLNPFSWFKATPSPKAAEVTAVPSPPKPEPKKEPPKKLTANELRIKLRPLFDKFDADQVQQHSTYPPPAPP
jgi:hypothetical protein